MEKPIYPTDLTERQKRIVREVLPELFVRKYRYDTFEILNAIVYLVKTGCQWKMLPVSYPKWRCVYHHFLSWGGKGLFGRLMEVLTRKRRAAIGRAEAPSVAVVDSQSVKWGLVQSEKGFDGNKKVKGIKRHIAIDSTGLPMSLGITAANVHDSKGMHPIVVNLLSHWPTVRLIKADMSYRGSLEKTLVTVNGPSLECVKSNYGNADFVPLQGRWVVERTFSCIDSYRRVGRNYERNLHTAFIVNTLAFCCFLLRYFA